MAEFEDASDSPIAEPIRKRRKRSCIACRRCHSLKVKCSGGIPCQRCQSAKKASSCEYPPRERRVIVSASYLSRLRNSKDSDDAAVTINPQSPDADADADADADPDAVAFELSTAQPSRAPSQGPPADGDISNPIHEPRRIFQLDDASQQHQYVGESTYLAFGDRILQCLSRHPQPMTTSLNQDLQYVRNSMFARQATGPAGIKLPERIRATLLVRVALRFIGQDYHFFLHHDFLRQLEKAYEASDDGGQHDSVWLCKLFAVLALGEMYSSSLSTGRDVRDESVPGTGYFLTAVGLLQDLFEEPSIGQIETMLLFCFYSNALGRVKSAHMYSGMALRLSTCLGLHRSIPSSSTLSPTEREHRIRLWWTVYIFDRSTCSKLGQPITIHDSDIDVEMPSSDMFPPDNNPHKLSHPEHLIAYVNLARITGLIMSDIYAPSARASAGRLVQNVRTILQKLRKWDAHIPVKLRWNPEGGVPRPVASLQLHFNQCIILTTRPILLYVLKVKNPFPSPPPTTGDPKPSATSAVISNTARSLADSCISAARTSNTILSQLFVENALATCGYFDAHHLFASTLVLIISAITSPNSSDSDAAQTAFQLLMMMRDNGNAAAGQYFSRLAQIQWNVSRLFAKATAAETAAVSSDIEANMAMNNMSPNQLLPVAVDFDNYDWSNFLIPNSYCANFDETEVGNITADPLANPLLQAFLDHADASRDGNSVLSAEEMGFVL